MTSDSKGMDEKCKGENAVRISAAIITLNEESRLRRCLESIRWMDEIVVVDSGSTDKTCEIAREFGCKVIHRDFDDYGTQKNFTNDQCSGVWIFSIDADEVVPEELKQEILATIARSDSSDMYMVPRRNIYFGKYVPHVFANDEPVRLFKRGKARFEGIVHEKLSGGSEGRLHSQLLHYSCETFSEWVGKHRKYVRLNMKKEYTAGKRFSLLRLLFGAFAVFSFRYIKLQGWKDGLSGFRVALEMAGSSIMGEWQLYRLAREPRA